MNEAIEISLVPVIIFFVLIKFVLMFVSVADLALEIFEMIAIELNNVRTG